MKASIALQILLSHVDSIPLSIKSLLSASSRSVHVGNSLVVLEGDFDDLMRILKEALEVAGQGADNVFINVKINIGEILSITRNLKGIMTAY